MQYLLPTAAIPDFVFAIATGHFPVLFPMTALATLLTSWAMLKGTLRVYKDEPWSWQKLKKVTGNCVITSIYILHWLVVMPITTARMSVRRKRLKWVKTVHQGEQETLVSQS